MPSKLKSKYQQRLREGILNFLDFVKENYEYEDFTINDIEFVKELYQDGMTEIKQLSIEADLSEETIKQIIFTLRKRKEID